jgi:hypothetical protein
MPTMVKPSTARWPRPTAALSEQILGQSPAVLTSAHEQSVPIFQQIAGGYPSFETQRFRPLGRRAHDRLASFVDASPLRGMRQTSPPWDIAMPSRGASTLPPRRCVDVDGEVLGRKMARISTLITPAFRRRHPDRTRRADPRRRDSERETEIEPNGVPDDRRRELALANKIHPLSYPTSHNALPFS